MCKPFLFNKFNIMIIKLKTKDNSGCTELELVDNDLQITSVDDVNNVRFTQTFSPKALYEFIGALHHFQKVMKKGGQNEAN